MKADRTLLSSGRTQILSVGWLLALLEIVLVLWSQNATGQQPALQKLTLLQIEGLVLHGVPDSTMAAQIQRRGLAFAPTPASLEELRAKGAGPMTLAAIEELSTKAAPRAGIAPTAGLPRNASQPPIVRDDHVRACALIGKQDYSRQITSDHASWIQLNRGQERNGYSFATNGSLFYSGQMLTNNIPVSGSSDNHLKSTWVYAQSIALSSKSPSGRFSILQACEQPDLGGLCWALFVVDHSSMHMERTSAGKYGPDRWISWILGDDEYAVLRYRDEGQTTYYRIHLPTGESTECGAINDTGSGAGGSNGTPVGPEAAPGVRQGASPAGGGIGVDGFYRVGGDVSAPVPVFQVEAEFSEQARKEKYQGVCLVGLVVDAKGNPQNVHIVRGLGMGLDEKAIEAVKRYRFRPAVRNGITPVPVYVNVEVNFRLY